MASNLVVGAPGMRLIRRVVRGEDGDETGVGSADTAAMASLEIHEIVNPIVNLLVPRRLTSRMNCIEVKIGSVSPSTFPMRLTQHLNRIQYFKGIMYFPLNIQRKLLRTHSDRNTN